jgi:FkbM family methyltransferase
MKKVILKLANTFLSPFGAKIIRKEDNDFTMSAAIKRIVDHRIPVKSVIDIGASNGKWSIETMRSIPQAAYLAIEPLHEHEGALKDVKQKYKNFDYVLCVAGDTDGQQVILNVSDDLDGSTVNASGGEQRAVPLRTLDAIISEKKLDAPFLLKFDTHGYEIPILQGAKAVLAKSNIIIMEVYNFKITDNALQFHEMCLHMEKLGFRCFDIAGPSLRPYDKAFWQMDIFFCHSDSKIFSCSRYR